MRSRVQPFVPETVAAVDLGSNSFHMVVARTGGGDLAVVDRMREMVQLADGLDDRKKISRKAQERALDCLRRFGERLRPLPPGSVRAVGTNTLRSARNARPFVERAEEALGHPIETISGIEEARLVYLGVAHSSSDPGRRMLVVDIGGGSTELIVGERFEPITMQSLYMGCVTMSRRWFPDGTISASALKRAHVAALQELEPVAAGFVEQGWEVAVGASGTVRAAAAVLHAMGWTDDGLTADALDELREALLESGHVEQLRFPGLSPQRRAVFPGGVVVLGAVFEALGLRAMQVSDGALREGVLYDLLGRIREEDVRSRSVAALADRCHVDWSQANRVERTAMALLEQVESRWRLDGRESRSLLSWSAQLHEIGLDIAHSHHHKHGQYIVEMADMAGFSRQEQQRLAMLVRAHRRKVPVAELSELPQRERKRIERLAILLRLAAVFHRSRSAEPMPDVTIRASKRAVTLGIDGDWLDLHPLTAADLDQEAGYLGAVGYTLTVERGTPGDRHVTSDGTRGGRA